MSGVSGRQMIVRPMVAADLDGLVAALVPQVSARQTRNRWQEHLSGYRVLLVAEMDGRVVGTVSLGGARYQIPNSLRMFALDVVPRFQRRGVGSALIAAVEREALRRKMLGVNLEVAADNEGAFRLYERLGYCREGDMMVDRWWRIADDGTRVQMEELSWQMLKRM